MSEDIEGAKEQARSQLDSIVEMMKRLDHIEGNEDEAKEAITEGPLSVQVRSDWHEPGDGNDKPTEYNILLCTGGPAVRIIGDLDEHGQPENAKLEYQNWFTPWIRYANTSIDEDTALLNYAREFYFGE